MALTMTVEFRGITVSSACIRVTSVSVLPGLTSMSFGIVFSASSGDDPFDARTVSNAPYDIDGPNPIAQAYAYLKTLPEFAGAEDC
jgi:hypothetical protein